MRQDLEALTIPLEIEKKMRQRRVLRSFSTFASVVLLLFAVISIELIERSRLEAGLFLVVGLILVGLRIRRSARWREPVPDHWPILAVECRLSRDGRSALTGMLLGGPISCDDAIEWGRRERDRLIDDLRERALCREMG
jgi:hypothetical protein